MLDREGKIKILTKHIEAILNTELRISMQDSLYSVGFDSIRMMALSNRLRSEGFTVTFVELMRYPTLESWLSLLDNRVDQVSCVSSMKKLPVEFPLATMQHAYWVGSMQDELFGDVAAHLYVEFDGSGIDPVKLEQAIKKLVERHDMLRVKILDNGQQRILSVPEHEVLTVINFRHVHHNGELNNLLEDLRAKKSQQRILRDQNKVFDITLTLLPEEQFRLHVDVDMIAADAVSYRIIMHELVLLYIGDTFFHDINYSYKEYILTKKNQSDSKQEEDKKWWQKKIVCFPDAPNLPIYHSGVRDKSKTERIYYWIDPEQRKAIELFAQNNRVTLAMTLLTIFAESIATHCQEKSFFLNIPLFDRDSSLNPEVNKLVGDFSTSILLEFNFDESMDIRQRIKTVTQTFMNNAEHSSYSALEVLRELSKQRGSIVLAPIVYTSAVGLGELFSKEVVEVLGKPVWILSQGPQVLLDAQITEFDGGFLANWDVRTEWFLPTVVGTMFETYKEKILQLVAEANQLDYFQSKVIQQQIELRNQFNNISYSFQNKPLHQKFFENALKQPNKIALQWRERGTSRQMTYRELAEQALKIAAYLLSNDISSGDKVGICLYKGAHQVATVIGVLALGAAYVPIGVNQPDTRKQKMLKIAQIPCIITERSLINTGLEVKQLLFEDAMQERPLDKPVFPTSDKAAYIIFTSGSTGEPKGVEVSHQAVMNTLEVVNHIFGINHEDKSLAFSSLEFDLSIQDLFGLFNVGGSVVLLADRDRYDAEVILSLLHEFKVTQLYAVPSLLEMLLAANNKISVPSLKLVILGGDKILPGLYAQFHQANPDCRFAGLGGATETAIHCTYFEVKEPLDKRWSCVPYGYPLYNNSCRIVDELGNDCPNLVNGEIWVGGCGVANGYINMPDIAQQKFVIQQGKRWYKTGDLGRYLNNGAIEYIGRKDNQVKLRGYRIELDEIEAILNGLTYVYQSIVLLVRNKGTNLVAFIRPQDTQILIDEQQIKEDLLQYLPNYMIPERIILVKQFPVNQNNKIDRQQLLVLSQSELVNTIKTPPKSPLEQLITNQFSKITGVKEIFLEDDFFALGGDSVLAVKLITELRQVLDFDLISVSDIFETKTVNALLSRLKKLEPEEGLLEKTAEIMLELDQIFRSNE